MKVLGAKIFIGCEQMSVVEIMGRHILVIQADSSEQGFVFVNKIFKISLSVSELIWGLFLIISSNFF